MRASTILKTVRGALEATPSQADIARRTGLSKSFLSRFASGEREDLSVESLVLLANALGLTVTIEKKGARRGIQKGT